MNDRLMQLALFVRTVESASFSRAAREFRLTQPSVSRAVAALESRLGVKLITRTTRQISATDAGLALLPRARDALAASRTPRTPREGLTSSPACARRSAADLWGAADRPSSPAFLDRRPLLKIDLLMSDRYENLIAEDADLALRIRRPAGSSFVARKLESARRFFVAAPSYLARRTRRRPSPIFRGMT